jgi:hypothetical protein
VTGLFLVAMMAGLTVFIWYLTVNAAKDPEQARKLADERTLFTGMYALFAVIALFGLNGIVMGTWQVITGRRNKVLMWVMFVLLALILIACFATVFVVQ